MKKIKWKLNRTDWTFRPLWPLIYPIIDIDGFWWYYKWDEVGWIWPWRRFRNADKTFCCSTLGFSPWNKLKEIDKFWFDYFEEMIKREESQEN